MYTESYTESHKIIKNNNLSYKTHQKHPNPFTTIHFFNKFISVGLPRPLPTAFELKNKFAYVKNTPDATTLTLYALNQLRSTKKHQKGNQNFSNLLFVV